MAETPCEGEKLKGDERQDVARRLSYTDVQLSLYPFRLETSSWCFPMRRPGDGIFAN